MRGRSVIEINLVGPWAMRLWGGRVVTEWHESPTSPPALCGEEFGHGAAASRCLVLHPNVVPVIHKSLVYQCLLVFLSTSLAN